MKHSTKYWLYCVFAFGTAALIGLILGITIPAREGSFSPMIALSIALGTSVIALAITWLWWSKTDDVQQHGQLISWYWGGTLGALTALIYLVMAFGRHSDISLGAGYLFIAQGAGFVIMWLVWRLRGRGATE